jgi:hypothetical protein
MIDLRVFHDPAHTAFGSETCKMFVVQRSVPCEVSPIAIVGMVRMKMVRMKMVMPQFMDAMMPEVVMVARPPVVKML